MRRDVLLNYIVNLSVPAFAENDPHIITDCTFLFALIRHRSTHPAIPNFRRSATQFHDIPPPACRRTSVGPTRLNPQTELLFKRKSALRIASTTKLV